MYVGFSGYAQTGKTTCADFLAEQYGFIQLGFADKLREFLYEMNPIVHVNLDANVTMDYRDGLELFGYEQAKKVLPGFREVLKDAGMAARNVFGDTFWVRELEYQINSDTHSYVFSDVRFLSEAKFIQDKGGIVIRLVRRGIGPDSDHASETEMDRIVPDYILENSATLMSLRLDLLHIINNQIRSNND